MRARHHLKGGFTLVELLVVIGIIAVLISLLLPALNRARQAGNTANCLSNLRQIGQAIRIYANDNNDYLVPGREYTPVNPGPWWEENWATLLVSAGYLQAPNQNPTGTTYYSATSLGVSVFRCPNGLDLNWENIGYPMANSQTDGNGMVFWRWASSSQSAANYAADIWYCMNGLWSSGISTFNEYPFRDLDTSGTYLATGDTYCPQLHKLSSITRNSDMALIFDGLIFHNGNYHYFSMRHNGNSLCNMLFADGHADSIASRQLPQSNAGIYAAGITPKFRLDIP